MSNGVNFKIFKFQLFMLMFCYFVIYFNCIQYVERTLYQIKTALREIAVPLPLPPAVWLMFVMIPVDIGIHFISWPQKSKIVHIFIQITIMSQGYGMGRGTWGGNRCLKASHVNRLFFVRLCHIQKYHKLTDNCLSNLIPLNDRLKTMITDLQRKW